MFRSTRLFTTVLMLGALSGSAFAATLPVAHQKSVEATHSVPHAQANKSVVVSHTGGHAQVIKSVHVTHRAHLRHHGRKVFHTHRITPMAHKVSVKAR